MGQQLATRQQVPTPATLEEVLMAGDLTKLDYTQRLEYYNQVCQSLDLNPLTRPFDYIVLNGKLTLYARKDATEQLRKRDRVSVAIVAREMVEGVYIVTARASTPDGRHDESIGAVSIENLKGEARANAMMKAETKAKRRVTLSICGLGFLDETEVETIPSAHAPEATPKPSTRKETAVKWEELLDDAFMRLGYETELEVKQVLKAAGFGAFSLADYGDMIQELEDEAARRKTEEAETAPRV